MRYYNNDRKKYKGPIYTNLEVRVCSAIIDKIKEYEQLKYINNLVEKLKEQQQKETNDECRRD